MAKKLRKAQERLNANIKADKAAQDRPNDGGKSKRSRNWAGAYHISGSMKVNP